MALIFANASLVKATVVEMKAVQAKTSLDRIKKSVLVK
jgi:hypothetical protein